MGSNAWRFPKMISVNFDVAHVNAVIENPMEMTDTYKLLVYGIINIASIFQDGCITPLGPHCMVASGAHHLQGPHLLWIRGLSSLNGAPVGDQALIGAPDTLEELS